MIIRAEYSSVVERVLGVHEVLGSISSTWVLLLYPSTSICACNCLSYLANCLPYFAMDKFSILGQFPPLVQRILSPSICPKLPLHQFSLCDVTSVFSFLLNYFHQHIGMLLFLSSEKQKTKKLLIPLLLLAIDLPLLDLLIAFGS